MNKSKHCASLAALVLLGSGMPVPGQTPANSNPADAPQAAEPLSNRDLGAYTSQWELSDALRLIESGKLQAALEKVNSVLARHPDLPPAREVLGIVLVLQGRTDEGLAQLQRAVQLNPKQSTAITKIGDVYLARNELEKARSQFEQAIALNPDDRWAHQRLGLLYEQEDDIKNAIIQFENGLRDAPADYLGVKVNLARLYNRSLQFGKAYDLLISVVKTNAGPEAHLALGTAALGLGRPKEALQHFERARTIEPNAAKTQLALGIAYREAGDLKSSERELAKALKIDPGFSAADYQMGETLAQLNRLPEAIRYYQKAAAGQANSIAISNRIAAVYSQNRQYAEAMAVYKAIITSGRAGIQSYGAYSSLLQQHGQLSEAGAALLEACGKFPESAEAKWRLGMHYALIKQYAKAVGVLEDARSKSPADPRILKALSVAQLRAGNLEQAIVHARRLVAVAPQSMNDHVYLATLLEQDNRQSEAAALYEKVLLAAPDDAVALNNLAQIRMKQKQNAAALKLAAKAKQIMPEHAAILDTYGWALRLNGDPASAATALEKALAADGNNPTYHYHLATVYSMLGRKAKALEHVQIATKSTRRFPEREEAGSLEASLRGL